MDLEPLSPEILLQRVSDLDAVDPCFEAGGFKWVYVARVHGQKEALKVLVIRDIRDPDSDLAEAYREEQIARVRREIKALRKCQTPEIVKLGNIKPISFEVDGRHYLAYSEEFVAGQDLWKLIRSGTSVPPLQELAQLFISLLHCIQKLWSYGYVHRDIKPKNVMRTGESNRPFVLLDFGIAFAVHETSITYRADERMPMATFRYLAPEMMSPGWRDRIDFRTDLYTTGVTVYEYGAGRHPLAKDTDDLMRTVSRALHQSPTPFRQRRADLPEGFCALVDGLLKKKPALRPANIGMLLKKLEAIP